jgi:predicted RNA-binding Zn-ribbon protein involved in translation (DUF1610 family)
MEIAMGMAPGPAEIIILVAVIGGLVFAFSRRGSGSSGNASLPQASSDVTLNCPSCGEETGAARENCEKCGAEL